MELDYRLIENTYNNLAERQFTPYFVNTKEEVVPLLSLLVEDNSTVASGGSVTLRETGVTEYLQSGRFDYLEATYDMTPEQTKEIMRKRFYADAFFLSANAITEDGRIFQEDGASTRVAPMIYGPDKVFIVVGANKIVKTETEARRRIKEVAAKNCARIGFKTPCTEDGKCHDCRHEKRSCCTAVTLEFSRIPGRITVIIVGEELGL